MNFTDQRVVFAAMIVAALVVEVAILVWFFGDRDGSDDEPVTSDGRVESRFDDTAGCGETTPAGSPPNARFDDARRFAIEVPPAWRSKSDGSVVSLYKKNGRATLSVGRARSGDLSVALEDLRSSLRRSYRDLNVSSEGPLLLDGCPARSIAGRARNRRGAILNFEGVVVSGPTHNFVIAGFLERGSEPRLDARVGRVIRSVRFFLSADGDRAARS
jgi:hypothetical protein